MEGSEQYQKFKESRQEKLRLEIALQEFFHETAEESHRAEYGAYLQRRIRPAVEKLIADGEMDRLERLLECGWVKERALDTFIAEALQQDQRAVLLLLLSFKDRTFGFKDREFKF